VVFDWLDRNHNGVVTRKNLEQGLISTGTIMCDSLGHWLWLYTPRDNMESPEDHYSLIADLQRLIPSQSFQRFLDLVVSTTGTIAREEWISPRSISLKEAIEWFTSARCGDILSNLSSINSILSFSSVTPAPLAQKEVNVLEQLLLKQQNSSVFAQRILFLRSI
jgi:hypothetical protein